MAAPELFIITEFDCKNNKSTYYILQKSILWHNLKDEYVLCFSACSIPGVGNILGSRAVLKMYWALRATLSKMIE